MKRKVLNFNLMLWGWLKEIIQFQNSLEILKCNELICLRRTMKKEKIQLSGNILHFVAC